MNGAPANAEVLVAFHRFGLGLRPGAHDLKSIAKDPRGFVAEELRVVSPLAPPNPLLAHSTEIFALLEAQRKQEREARAARSARPDMSKDGALPDMARPVMAAAPPAKPGPAQPTPLQERTSADARARLALAHAAGCGVVERLVAFWSNHFCVVSARSGHVQTLAGAYEREAIRPHVLGRFSDMILAAEQHPAMLFFLENHNSVGPGSPIGVQKKRGLNENLAREALELHTLGVGGGYTQADVTSLARMLTGWTVAGADGKLGRPGAFAFNPEAHEPGPHKLMGRVYAEEGRLRGEKALRDVARRTATLTRLARKFASHFVADDPPPGLVSKLAKNLRDTDGDLRALAMTLIASDEAWKAPMTKIRSPYEFYIAAMRLLSPVPEATAQALRAMSQMGQPLWSPPGPDGYPDTNDAWATPNAIKARFDMAVAIARSHKVRDPRDLLERAFVGLASDATRTAIARAESGEQGLALLLMSPEFLRR